MSKKISLTDIIVQFLKEEGKPYTAREIARSVIKDARWQERFSEKRERSKHRFENDAHFISQIASEISAYIDRARGDTKKIRKLDEKPYRFYYPAKTGAERFEEFKKVAQKRIQDTKRVAQDMQAKLEDKRRDPLAEIAGAELYEQTQSKDKIRDLSEKTLYPILGDFLLTQKIYSMLIDDAKSGTKRGYKGRGHWLHPDWVGINNLTSDWTHRGVKDLAQKMGAKRCKLWSFEVKKTINGPNARECFFQTVSNSSWAHMAYLVAEEINEDGMRELGMLAERYGIGVIKLNRKNPSESSFLIPAREREEIDWNFANKLADRNKDFAKYIKLVDQFHATNEIKPHEWHKPHKKLRLIFAPSPRSP